MKYVGDEAMDLITKAFDAAWRASGAWNRNMDWEPLWEDFLREHGLEQCYIDWKHRVWPTREIENLPISDGCPRHDREHGMIHTDQPCTCGEDPVSELSLPGITVIRMPECPVCGGVPSDPTGAIKFSNECTCPVEPLANNGSVFTVVPPPSEPEPSPEFDPEYLDEVYDRWDSYEDGRFYLKGESMWCKVLPDYKGMRLVGLNNMPVTDGFMLHDIFEGEPNKDFVKGQLRHRRWHREVPFNYDHDEDKEKDKVIRDQIRDRVETRLGEGQCHLSWWCPGVGRVLVVEDDFQVAGEMVDEALGDLGAVPWEE